MHIVGMLVSILNNYDQKIISKQAVQLYCCTPHHSITPGRRHEGQTTPTHHKSCRFWVRTEAAKEWKVAVQTLSACALGKPTAIARSRMSCVP